MDISFSDIFDFTASSDDWVKLIEDVLWAIADFFKHVFNFDIFKPEATTETTTDNA